MISTSLMQALQADILDGFIGLLIALVILSIISEKLCTLIRTYTFFFKWTIIFLSLGGLVVLWGCSPLMIDGGWGYILLYLILFVLLFIGMQKEKQLNWARSMLTGLNAYYPDLEQTDEEKQQREMNVAHMINFLGVGVSTIIFVWVLKCQSSELLKENAVEVSLYTNAFLAGLTLGLRALINKDILKNINKGLRDDTGAKENEISLLSILVGVFIALCFGADVFQMFKSAMSTGQAVLSGQSDFPLVFRNDTLQFEPSDYQGLQVLGIVITGFFLSFGSRFFHDTLEYLLEVKNLKRKLSDKDTYDISSTAQLDQHLKLTDHDMVKSVFDENKAKLMSLPGVMGVSIASRTSGGSTVRGIKVITTDASQLMIDALTYTLPNGNGRSVAVFSEEVGEVAASCNSDVFPSAPLSIDNKFEGTYCLPVKDDDGSGEELLLTCYHVVKHASHDWRYHTDLGDGKEPTIQIGTGNIKGEIVRGFRNRKADAALIRAPKTTKLQTAVSAGGTKIKRSRAVIPRDDDRTSVKIDGAKTPGVRTATITGLDAIHKIDFGEAKAYEMHGLIEIQNSRKTKIVAKGDSGSLVYTDKGEALGMIVASYGKKGKGMALAIPIATIESEMEIKIKT